MWTEDAQRAVMDAPVEDQDRWRSRVENGAAADHLGIITAEMVRAVLTAEHEGRQRAPGRASRHIVVISGPSGIRMVSRGTNP